MSIVRQPWLKRQEIPDPQVRDAADQFESARKLLFGQPPGSGLLYPLVNTAAMAIELYLKCLSAEKEGCTEAEGEWSHLSASAAVRSHEPTTLLGKIGHDVRRELDRAFLAESSAFRDLSLRDALRQCEGAFEESRYPFDPNHDVSKYPIELLMACSRFLHQFVANLPTRETVQWRRPSSMYKQTRLPCPSCGAGTLVEAESPDLGYVPVKCNACVFTGRRVNSVVIPDREYGESWQGVECL